MQDIEGSKIGDYNKGRYYVILYDLIPFELTARVIEIGEFKDISESFLKTIKELNLKVE